MKKFHYPMGAKGEPLEPGHHKGRRQATQGAEEKDKWVWQRRPPTWAAELPWQGKGPWREQGAPGGGVGMWSQPLGSQVQVKVQLEKLQYPKWAKGGLLGPGHHQGRRRATQEAEENDKWV